MVNYLDWEAMMQVVVWFLLATFVHFYSNENLPYNIRMVAFSRRRKQRKNGLNSVLKHLPELECTIVGEPTLIQLVTEKGCGT
jgi:acetylornithine deacetylase